MRGWDGGLCPSVHWLTPPYTYGYRCWGAQLDQPAHPASTMDGLLQAPSAATTALQRMVWYGRVRALFGASQRVWHVYRHMSGGDEMVVCHNDSRRNTPHKTLIPQDNSPFVRLVL